MEILQIWMSQRGLRRFHQVPKMAADLQNGGELPQIVLCRCEDGEVQLQDGHHRLTAFWLSGRARLERHEYILVEGDLNRPRFGKVTDLLRRVAPQNDL